jgi:tetratricopeptide (TPR) repeat protein
MIAADRFSYIPLLGLMFATGQGSQFLWVCTERQRWMRILLIVTLIAVAYGLCTVTRQQISVWQSDTTLWSQVVEDNPSYAEGYNNLGITCAAQEKHVEALKNLNYAIILDSTDSEYFYNRGLLFLRMKQWRSAIQDFSRMIALNPLDVSGYAMRGNAYLENKSYRESISDYDQVLRAQPLAMNVRIERILAMVGNEDYSAALDEIDYLHSSGVQLDSAFIGKIQRQAQANLKH